jgi:hypothetical protein
MAKPLPSDTAAKPLPPTAVAIAFIDCINRNNLQGLTALMADGHRLEMFDDPPVVGRDANIIAWRGYMTSFPHYVIHPHRIHASGDTVAILGHTTGSHLDLPDDEEAQELLIWVAEIRHAVVTRWSLLADSPSTRARLGLD